MSDDLVKRLRAAELEYVESQPVGHGPPINPDGPEAADEIDRLRAEVAKLEFNTKDDGKWMSALFQLLREHGIDPASSDLIEAKKRADDIASYDKRRLREALEFYANPNSWRERFVNKGIGATMSEARDDAGRRARAILQEIQDQPFQEGVCGGQEGDEHDA